MKCLSLIRGLIFLASLAISTVAWSGEKADKQLYHHRGEINAKSLLDLQAHLDLHPETKGILFINCPGGGDALKLFNDYVALIDQYKLATHARGYCASLCASIFLMGYGKYLGPAEQDEDTVLQIHPIFKDGEPDYRATLMRQAAIVKRNPWYDDKSFYKLYDIKESTGWIKIFRQARSGSHVFFQERLGMKMIPISNQALNYFGIGTTDE